jgi:alanine dehydrogenase
MILGAGALGCNAARSFAGIGANVHVLDIERNKLDYLACHTAGMKVTTMFATKHNISMLIPYTDVIICAVLVPGKRSPILITKEMVKKMRRGSVIIDFSIDQGGCSETSKISPSGKFIYTVEGVRHFCMPNATTLVARTATHTITSSIYPYLKVMCELGMERALKENNVLNSGIYAENGQIRKEHQP